MNEMTVAFDLEVDGPDQLQTAFSAVASVFAAMTASDQTVYRDLQEVTLEMLLDSVHTDHTITQTRMDCTRQMALERALHTLLERSSVDKITVQCVFDPEWKAERMAERMVKIMLPDLHSRKRLNIVTEV